LELYESLRQRFTIISSRNEGKARSPSEDLRDAKTRKEKRKAGSPGENLRDAKIRKREAGSPSEDLRGERRGDRIYGMRKTGRRDGKVKLKRN
jgi:hypothetical protein